MIKYLPAPDIQDKVDELIKILDMDHVSVPRVVCVRSKGSSSRRTIARCHALGRIWQTALSIKAYYIIEVISERFDKMSEEERIKTLIHELLHIPKSFGGGFRHHDFVNSGLVDKYYRRYRQSKPY